MATAKGTGAAFMGPRNFGNFPTFFDRELKLGFPLILSHASGWRTVVERGAALRLRGFSVRGC